MTVDPTLTNGNNHPSFNFHIFAYYLPVIRVPWTIYEILVIYSLEKKFEKENLTKIQYSVDNPIAVISKPALEPPRYTTMLEKW